MHQIINDTGNSGNEVSAQTLPKFHVTVLQARVVIVLRMSRNTCARSHPWSYQSTIPDPARPTPRSPKI